MSDCTAALERLRSLFFEHFHVEVPSADTDLLESGMLDSLQLVDLLLLIEEEFGRRISLEAIELDDLRSLSRLAQLVGTSPALALDARSVSTGREGRGTQARDVRANELRVSEARAGARMTASPEDDAGIAVLEPALSAAGAAGRIDHG